MHNVTVCQKKKSCPSLTIRTVHSSHTAVRCAKLQNYWLNQMDVIVAWGFPIFLFKMVLGRICIVFTTRYTCKVSVFWVNHSTMCVLNSVLGTNRCAQNGRAAFVEDFLWLAGDSLSLTSVGGPGLLLESIHNALKTLNGTGILKWHFISKLCHWCMYKAAPCFLQHRALLIWFLELYQPIKRFLGIKMSFVQRYP